MAVIGSWQKYVCRVPPAASWQLGLHVSDEYSAVSGAWRVDAQRRAAQSLARREEPYKRERSRAPQAEGEARNQERKTTSKQHTYKELEGEGDGV
eukprot:scaffold197244_cov36-Tisochrysis_lutea.AAC.1